MLSRLFWGPYSATAGFVAIVTCALDQAYKLWMLFVFDIAAKGRVAVTPFLDLVFVKNKGISYSLLDQDTQTGQYLLAAFAVCASLVMWIWASYGAQTTRLLAISLGLIIGGAIGNAIDRLWLGGVADFFSLHAWGYYWYVFNIADVAIVAGVIGLLYESFLTSRKDVANTR